MMNPIRQRKILFLCFILVILTLVIGLVLYALRQNISLFFTPTQVVAGEAAGRSALRLGGMVVKGSIVRGEGLLVHFKLTDFKHTVDVTYTGILPDLFREGQGVVTLGTLIDNHHFSADQVLAKHDANYMPPEVKDALTKSVERTV